MRLLAREWPRPPDGPSRLRMTGGEEEEMSQAAQRTVLVIGSTGNQGGAVVSRLLEDGGWRIRGLSRDPQSERSQALAKRGVEIVQGDMNDVETLTAAMEGAFGLFFVPVVGKGVEGEIAGGSAVTEAAKRARVPHVIFSGVSGGNRKIGVPNFESKGTIEEQLRTAGLTHTVIRPVSFMENLNRTRDAIVGGRLTGVLNPARAQQFVSVRDIARFAVEAFKRPQDFAGQAIDLAGDDMTMHQVAEVLSRALKRPVTYNHIPAGEGRANMPPPMLVMNDFYEREGYGVDIAALRTRWGIPLLTLEQWLRVEPGWMA